MTTPFGFVYRYQEQNEHCLDYLEWSAWEHIDEKKAAEIQYYIDRGYSYELKAIYAENLSPALLSKLRG